MECYKKKIFREDKAVKHTVYFLYPRQDRASGLNPMTKLLCRKVTDKKRNELLIFEKLFSAYAFKKLDLA